MGVKTGHACRTLWLESVKSSSPGFAAYNAIDRWAWEAGRPVVVVGSAIR
jgi:hypothetical protein